MTKEEYKQLMNDYGFSVVEGRLGSYYVAFYGNVGCSLQNAFSFYSTDNGEVIVYTKLYFEKSHGICVVDSKIKTKNINEIRPVVINIAEQYKNLLIIQKKEEIKKDFI